MTTLGHSLMGASIGVLCMPGAWGWRAKAGLVAAFAVLGNIPDIANMVAPPGNYHICHSLFVNGAAMIALSLIAWRVLGRRPGWRPILIGGQAAWASHLLLDATYNDGHGVPIFWPIDAATLSLALPWFSTLKLPLADHVAENVRTYTVELLFYGGILLACVTVRRVQRRQLRQAA